MHLKIEFLIKKFRDWLPKAQAKIQAQAAELDSQVNQRNLKPLLQSQIINLSNKIDTLATPSSYRNLIQSKLKEAIAQWQSEKGAPNSLMVLGSPIEPLAKILDESLAEWENDNLWLVKSLSWSSRPPLHSSIKPELLKEIGLPQEHNSVEIKPEKGEILVNSSPERQILILIPDLSWCFLRCVDGLEGIDYLQDLLLEDRSRFWLIGCNNWAWEYLNTICQLDAYFEHTLSLPGLERLELKNWLLPVSETIDFEFGNGSDSDNDNDIINSDEQENWTSSSQKSYFEHLTSISLGLTSVATRLWLNSLGLEKEDDKSDQSENSESEEKSSSPKIILAWPKLPDLPELTKENLYVLFSLCLHGEMTLSELALSLGESENMVQDQIQVLRTSGILERNKKLIRINPIHYPKLRKKLANNHFLIGGNK